MWVSLSELNTEESGPALAAQPNGTGLGIYRNTI
jgi:hypothetical protein